MNSVCAWCGAPRTSEPTCHKCGADYEKAARIKAGKPATTSKRKRVNKKQRTAEREEKLLETWAAVEDVAFERQLTLWVVPSMLFVTFSMEVLEVGSSMLRIVFGMPVHELGHAIVGWFSGFTSIPTLWKTIIPESRGFIAPVILFGGLAYLINRARLAGNGGLMIALVILVLIQIICTFFLELKTAKMLVTWGGDGVGMLLATALMAGFCFGKNTGWYKDYLRWGFVFIGAAAFADMVTPWWVSLDDLSAVPYGQTGGTHTDTYKMMHYHGWEMDEVINRYVGTSIVCGILIAIFYTLGIRESKTVLELKKKQINDVED